MFLKRARTKFLRCCRNLYLYERALQGACSKQELIRGFVGYGDAGNEKNPFVLTCVAVAKNPAFPRARA
eukprot:6203334-Pleurochrysis_carterae.AAC.6